MGKMRRFISFVCVMALLAGLIPAGNVSAAIKVKSVQLDQTTYVMKKNEQFTLKAQIAPKSAKRLLWWKSSNPKVAEVNWKGEVTAKKKGKATITAYAGSKKSSCKVIVGTPVKKIKTSQNTVTVTAGKSMKLKTSVMPETASIKKLQYSSKNKKIATVSKSGVVKGLKKGTTQITVQSTDGSNKSKKVKVKVQPKTKENHPAPTPMNPTINLTINPAYYITIAASATPVGGNGNATGEPGGNATEEPGSNATKAPGSNATKAPGDSKQEINVTGVSLSETEKTINLNETLPLTASIEPENATNQNIVWKSSDASVASVSKEGVVTPDKEGSAEISVITADGNYSAKCMVTVLPKAVVSNNKEITYALSKKNLKTLEIKSDTAKKITVPKGTYQNVDMIVNLPNGELENNAVFKSIAIQEISEDTFFENAIGNVINILGKKSHVIIDKKASASVVISKDCLEVTLENNGEVKGLEINTAGKVDIIGESDQKIATQINAEVTVTTTQGLDINAKNRFDITVRPGAESTKITVDLEINIPKIFGVGVITVKITATGEIKTIVSENNGPDELAKTVKFAGSVRDMDGNPVEGAEIFVAPFQQKQDIQDVVSADDVVRLTTDSDGEYHSNTEIVTGNYRLAARKDGYMDLMQTVSIVLKNGNVYTNEEIILLPSEWTGQKGGITGTILDSAVKDLGLKDITIQLRRGKSTMNDDGREKEPTIASTITKADGKYSFADLDAGYYTLQLDDPKNEYIRTWVNVVVRPGEPVIENAIMSKELLTDQMRFVLSWGAKETGAVADVDAHLRGPCGYHWDNRFHIFFWDKIFNNDVETEPSRADLDVDDMDYSGPETATVYQKASGVYSYYVHDFSNRGSLDSTKLSESSVKVEVYSGNDKVNTYYIPHKEGTVWHVFDYDSRTDTFKTVNTMYYETDTYRVGCTVEDYKSVITSRINSIQRYYQSLEKGTGEDIPEKIKEYRQHMDALSDKQEGEAAKLYRAVVTYDNSLYRECCPSYDIDHIDTSSWNSQGKLTLYTTRRDYTPSEYQFTDRQGNPVEEVAKTDPVAWKAVRVTAENGHTQIVQIYIKFDFSHVSVDIVTNGEETMYATEGNGYQSEDSSQYYPTLYVSSSEGTDFALQDLQFTFSEELLEIQKDSKKAGAEYTVTVQSGDASKTWVVRKMPKAEIKAPDNQIYGQKLDGRTLTIFAERPILSEQSVFLSGGKEYSLHKSHSGEGYSYYDVYTDEMSFSVYCYSEDYAYGLTGIDFSQNVTASIDQKNSSVTVKAATPDVAAEDLTLNWGRTQYGSAEVKYETVSGEDHVGKIIVSVNGVTDYVKEYLVYFEPYQE